MGEVSYPWFNIQECSLVFSKYLYNKFTNFHTVLNNERSTKIPWEFLFPGNLFPAASFQPRNITLHNVRMASVVLILHLKSIIIVEFTWKIPELIVLINSDVSLREKSKLVCMVISTWLLLVVAYQIF